MKNWDEVEKNIKLIQDNEKNCLDTFNNLISKMVTRRKELGMSQKKLAELTKLSYQTISKIENFNREPSLKTLLRIYYVLKLELKISEKC